MSVGASNTERVRQNEASAPKGLEVEVKVKNGSVTIGNR